MPEDMNMAQNSGDNSPPGSEPILEPAAEPESKETLLEARVAELDNQWKRALADLENFRRRFYREQDRIKLEERKNSALILLEVIDNLDLAVKAAKDGSDPLVEGITAVIGQAETSLAKLGVERVPTVGARFDPALHTAINIVEGEEDNIIVGEHRRGYRIGEYLIRSAMVTVTRAKQKTQPEAEAKQDK